MGVMIRMMGQPDTPPNALADVKGLEITAIMLDDAANNGDGALLIDFTTGARLVIADRGRSCCESRYLKCDDDLGFFAGATLEDITIECGGTTTDEWDQCHEIQFMLVHTSKGVFTVNTHNEHNGYYGGFWMTADVIKPEDAAGTEEKKP